MDELTDDILTAKDDLDRNGISQISFHKFVFPLLCAAYVFALSVISDSSCLMARVVQELRKHVENRQKMKITSTILFGIFLLFSLRAVAQDRFEVYGEYSYLRFNPTVFGLNSRSFNGGGGGATLYFLHIFGIKADFMGYGSTTFTKTVSSPVVLPGGGIIPAGSYTSQGNMFTYLFGPVLRIPIPKVTPFGEILFGGSNTNGYANLTNSIITAGGTISRTPTQHPFTMAVGGGLDISLSKHIALRPGEIDYVLSRYSNPLTSTNNQNNFRYCGGVVFKF